MQADAPFPIVEADAAADDLGDLLGVLVADLAVAAHQGATFLGR